jgi:replication-associated recombination protein RarA
MTLRDGEEVTPQHIGKRHMHYPEDREPEEVVLKSYGPNKLTALVYYENDLHEFHTTIHKLQLIQEEL